MGRLRDGDPCHCRRATAPDLRERLPDGRTLVHGADTCDVAEGSDLARTTVRLMRLLREAPHRPRDLVDVLQVSRSTVDRLLRVLREEGEMGEPERRGREAFYRLKAHKETT